MDAPQPELNYLTVKEFIRRCPLSESTIRRRIECGDIPSIQPGGKNTKILVPADALSRLERPLMPKSDFKHKQDSTPSQRTNPRRRPNWRRGT